MPFDDELKPFSEQIREIVGNDPWASISPNAPAFASGTPCSCVLKTYKFAVRGNVALYPQAAGVVTFDELMPTGSKGILTDPLGTRHMSSRFAISPLTSGPFEGCEPVEALSESLGFCEQYLADVDRLVAERGGD